MPSTSSFTPGLIPFAATELLGMAGTAQDRFVLRDGAIAVVEHILPPRVLAVPFHIHTREDELSFVLEGRVGAQLGHEVLHGAPGDLIVKPRGQWHTFWNAGDSPARILELILPGGLEEAFRQIHFRPELADPEQLAALAASFGCDMDFERTGPLMERLGLTM
ncbi:MAG TPA: cupin domain-containing protein [Tepidiformaceae bacterium]|nr:cupin domain-containing protein [Tepidiformaceae bacterium]